jgi:hypothetical protein
LTTLLENLSPALSDHLFGVDGPIGSVWLDVTVPTLSLRSLHSLVIISGLVEASQAKSTY